MYARNPPTRPVFRRPGARLGAHREVVYLLLTTLAVFAAACQSTPAATQQWTPPYLELHLYAGKAQVQWSNRSEWTTMEGKAGIVIDDRGRISADTTEGAQFYLGDGSTLELAPGAMIEVINPRTFPRLQVAVQDGSILFTAQKPSYEFVMPDCPVTLLSVPALVRIEVNGQTTRLAVEEGAVTCKLGTETLTLPTCREMYLRPGEEPDVAEFCTPSTAASPRTPTPSPSPTPPGFEPTLTPTAAPSFTPTPTRREVVPTPTRRGVVPTPTHTSVPPTAKPAQSKPKKTQPPPTQPPPTQPPPTQPPPTQPPPPPTEPRPTPEPPEPTPKPPEPTSASPRPTAEPS
jgi:hypothetical protein